MLRELIIAVCLYPAKAKESLKVLPDAVMSDQRIYSDLPMIIGSVSDIYIAIRVIILTWDYSGCFSSCMHPAAVVASGGSYAFSETFSRFAVFKLCI